MSDPVREPTLPSPEEIAANFPQGDDPLDRMTRSYYHVRRDLQIMARHVRNLTAIIIAPTTTAEHRNSWIDLADDDLTRYVEVYGDV